MKNNIHFFKYGLLTIVAITSIFLIINYFYPTQKQPNYPTQWTEANILQLPQNNASEEIKTNHFNTSLEIAKNTDTVEISNCVANPKVIKIKANATIKVKNVDTKDSIIYFNAQETTIASGKSEIMAKDTDLLPGLYTYGCKNANLEQPLVAGILIIEPQ